MATQMVLLEHTLPDGSQHFDWMLHEPPIADTAAFQNLSSATDDPAKAHRKPVRTAYNAVQPDDNDRILITFRVLDRIDRHDCDSFVADRLDPHRYAYLKHHGPVSGNRGSVRKVAGGLVRIINNLPGGISIRARFTGGQERIWAGMQEGDVWNFRRGQPVIKKTSLRGRESEDGSDSAGGYLGGDAAAQIGWGLM